MTRETCEPAKPVCASTKRTLVRSSDNPLTEVQRHQRDVRMWRIGAVKQFVAAAL
jgi:hypothetical protein